MKTTRTHHAIVSLLSVTLLSLSVASAQSNPPDAAAVDKHAASKQQKREALISQLSITEKRQLRTAVRQVHDDPKMVAARQAVKDAQTKEAKHEASVALRTLRHDLLMKADPALAGPSFKEILNSIDGAPAGNPGAQPK